MVPLKTPPGVFRNGTQLQANGRWYDANWVRWINGTLRPIGGWVAVTSATTGKARALHGWRLNDKRRMVAIGTSSKLYAYNGDGTLYDITPAGMVAGADDASENTGYGGSTYGTGAYGVTRPVSGTPTPPTMWTLDNFGDYLIACQPDDGRIFEWLDNTANPAVVTTNAPTGNVGVLVTDQRHVMALGAGGDQRLVKWSASEDRNTWVPLSTNEAGSIQVQTNGLIQCGVKTRGQVLVLTDVDVHAFTYLGAPYVFGRERVGQDCGVLSRGAAASAGDFAVWMGSKRFWIYRGGAAEVLPSDVEDYVYGSLNTLQAGKVVAGHNGTYGELWWFYPSGSSTENDRYVVWNYRENHWTIGGLARTAWEDIGAFTIPLAMGADNKLYQHESGFSDNGNARTSQCYAEGGYMTIGNGENIVYVDQMIPDEKTSGQTQIKFRGSKTTNGTSTLYGPYLVRGDGFTDCRFSDRQLAPRIEGTTDADWRVGTLRFSPGKPAGKR